MSVLTGVLTARTTQAGQIKSKTTQQSVSQTQGHDLRGNALPLSMSVPPDKNWVVLHGPAKGAFGQPGGAPQWVVIDRTTGLEVPVEELIDEDMLWEPGLADEGLSPMRPQK
jgi:hypothetical protein